MTRLTESEFALYLSKVEKKGQSDTIHRVAPTKHNRGHPVLMATPTEHWEQCQLFVWAKKTGILAIGDQNRQPRFALSFYKDIDARTVTADSLDDSMFAIPNAGKRGPIAAKRMISEGLKAGVPDIFIPVPRGRQHGLFIEMKPIRGGHLQDHQEVWCRRLYAAGYAVAVCRGHNVAIAVIMKYLDLGEGEEMELFGVK